MNFNRPANANDLESVLDFDLDETAVEKLESLPAQADIISTEEPHVDFDSSPRSLAEQVWERRGRPRLHQQDKGVRSLLRGEINYLVAMVESSWRGWMALILSIVLSVALLYWSLTVRKDMLHEHKVLSQELAYHQTELDNLLERWSQGELKTLKERVHSAESRVFPNYQRLAAWLNHEAFVAQQLDLTMRYNLSNTMQSQIKDVGEVPIKIMVTAKLGMGQHSYLRMLEFVHGMVGDQWHLEITNATVQSNGQGVTNMNVTVHVWVHDENIPVQES